MVASRGFGFLTNPLPPPPRSKGSLHTPFTSLPRNFSAAAFPHYAHPLGTLRCFPPSISKWDLCPLCSSGCSIFILFSSLNTNNKKSSLQSWVFFGQSFALFFLCILQFLTAMLTSLSHLLPSRSSLLCLLLGSFFFSSPMLPLILLLWVFLAHSVGLILHFYLPFPPEIVLFKACMILLFSIVFCFDTDNLCCSTPVLCCPIFGLLSVLIFPVVFWDFYLAY